MTPGCRSRYGPCAGPQPTSGRATGQLPAARANRKRKAPVTTRGPSERTIAVPTVHDTSARLEPGELVNIRIDRARVTNIYPTTRDGVGTGMELVADYGTERAIAVNLAERSVTVERVAPQQWPPVAGDVWEDRFDELWFAACGADGCADDVMMIYAGDMTLHRPPEELLAVAGPLTLDRRRGWAPDEPSTEDEPEEVDRRAATVAGLRAFADLLANRTDIEVPYQTDAQVGYVGEEGLADAQRIAASLGVELREPRDTGTSYQRWVRTGRVLLGGGVILTLYVHGLDAPQTETAADPEVVTDPAAMVGEPEMSDRAADTIVDLILADAELRGYLPTGTVNPDPDNPTDDTVAQDEATGADR